MGGAVSASSTNEELVDKLVAADYITEERAERILKALDRAHYYLPRERRLAYRDLAWRRGNLHLSAPCIYAQACSTPLTIVIDDRPLLF